MLDPLDRFSRDSTISYFIERVGNEGFGEIFQLFNEELLRLGLLSRKVYADSSLVRANVSGHDLSPSGMTVEEFREKAVEENGLSIVRGCFQSLILVLDLMYETQTIPQRPYRRRVGHSASLTPASQAWRTATHSRHT